MLSRMLHMARCLTDLNSARIHATGQAFAMNVQQIARGYLLWGDCEHLWCNSMLVFHAAHRRSLQRAAPLVACRNDSPHSHVDRGQNMLRPPRHRLIDLER